MSSVKRPRTPSSASSPRHSFRATSASDAATLTDCAQLPNDVLMPWIGFGTYRLGTSAQQATLAALRCGYRMIDTAYIYSGEKTEAEVGKALRTALQDADAPSRGLHSRDDVFIITKHWRKFHGYAPALGCLDRSLSRLGVDYVDLWLMHWPGPAWSTMNRRNDELEKYGPWHYALDGHGQEQIAALRAETWRAMEEALRVGKARSIGVSNFTVAHLETLKKTAKVWPPAVNQVEAHPLYPQAELREYCAREGIVLQAYAALGGQDASKAKWESLGGRLIDAPPVLAAAAAHGVEGGDECAGRRDAACADAACSADASGTDGARRLDADGQVDGAVRALPSATPAQVLLRWALQKGMSVTPKSSHAHRMAENAACVGFSLSAAEVAAIDALEAKAALGGQHDGRLCWRSDPLRLLDFD